MSLEGRLFGRYRLGPRIGKGGMGEVYKAVDIHIGREVAIKVLEIDDPDTSQEDILLFLAQLQDNKWM